MVMDVSVFVCPSACKHISKATHDDNTSNLIFSNFCACYIWPCCPCSVLLWRHRDMSCTSGFMALKPTENKLPQYIVYTNSERSRRCCCCRLPNNCSSCRIFHILRNASGDVPKLPLPLGNPSHHLIRDFLGQPESTSQTASRLVQTF